jgi:DNA-binding beta-propeller fold protein YncE
LLAAGTAAAQGAPSAVPRAAVGGRDMGIPFANLSCVAVNPRHGEILAADQGRGEIATFDTLGVPLGFFVHSVPGPDGAPRDGRPAFLAVDGDGRLLVSDLEAPFVDVLDVRGRSLGRLELPGDSLDFGDGPGAIAVGPDGRIFVASRGHRGRIHVFGPDHAHRGSWGEAGQDSARIADVTGLAVDARHRVWIACASTRLCVQVFDDAGRFAFGFGLHDMGPRNFSLPSGIALTSDGRVWVGDGIRHIVQVFDSQGTHLGPIGGLGNGPGDLQYPCALATDGRDLLVVAERVGKRFQVWRTR